MTDVLRLRTMARGSVIPAGKFEHRTVQQIIDLGDINYLLFQYYNYSKISYLPDILEEIGVTKERMIKKPGKLSYEEWRKIGKEIHTELNAKISRMDWQKKHSHQMKRARKKSKRVEDSMHHSRGWLANRNRKKLNF